MTPLLSPESFPGEWISAERAGVSWVGEAYFDGLLAVISLDRTDAARLLPVAWETTPNVSATPHRHPVVFALGRQRRTAVLFGGLTLPSDADYGELMIAVPFVRRLETATYLHTFVPRMYAGDARATWSGNTFYGFGKRMATFDRLGPTQAVVDQVEGLVMHATAAATGPWRPGADMDGCQALTLLQSAFRHPVRGVRADGSEIASYFDWRLDTASVRPVDAVIELHDGLGGGFEAGTCHTPAGGALEVQGMRWRLSWPTPR